MKVFKPIHVILDEKLNMLLKIYVGLYSKIKQPNTVLKTDSDTYDDYIIVPLICTDFTFYSHFPFVLYVAYAANCAVHSICLT